VRWLRDHGLSAVLSAVFVACMAAQVWAGRLEHNEELRQHGEPSLSLSDYLASGHFWEATAENWESEFLQMAAYVLLTVGLYQKGSSESKKPGESEAVDRDPRSARGKRLADAPWPVRKGGWVLRLYENSLSIAFLVLFSVSFWLHAAGGARMHNTEERLHGGDMLTVGEYLATPKFWFESFQNWQSEFLSLVAMVVLSIWLRQRGSPESKPVDSPHSRTGSE
jgi:membrane protein implicated in regulation of membrane protease activity